MKKLLTLFSVFCLCLLIPFSALAGNTAETCTDSEQNISFTVPAGWTRYSDAETDSMKYIYIKDGSDNDIIFSYSFVDIFSASGSEFQEQYPREKIDNKLFTKEEVQEMFTDDSDVNSVSVDTAELGNYEYFKISFVKPNGSSATNATVYMHIYNGYAYYFRMEGTKQSPDTATLDEIVKTVEFKNETKKNKTQTNNEKLAKEVGKSAAKGALTGAVKAGIVALVAIVSSIILRLVKSKKGKNVVNENQTNNTYNTSDGE